MSFEDHEKRINELEAITIKLRLEMAKRIKSEEKLEFIALKLLEMVVGVRQFLAESPLATNESARQKILLENRKLSFQIDQFKAAWAELHPKPEAPSPDAPSSS
jgi:hypothetical protein